MLQSFKRGRLARASIAVVIATGLVACGGGGGGGGAVVQPLQLATVNARADQVTDGDALVQVTLPSGVAASSLQVMVNGQNVSSSFARRPDGRVTGLVTGLGAGNNVILASAEGATPAQLTVTNTPKGGTVLSGPYVVPFY